MPCFGSHPKCAVNPAAVDPPSLGRSTKIKSPGHPTIAPKASRYNTSVSKPSIPRVYTELSATVCEDPTIAKASQRSQDAEPLWLMFAMKTGVRHLAAL
ncbi:Protein of unknown function [Pyronema omphalodes CBS 100304]|uniref:Uncharacterized protein n=1 Tax=Pyronema omphalodes (strain CBS 100304) TaxID=1076935 RepID=U4L2Z3_PYROM|nr:Protein of unknown function [Pyronema omphalodes CBS 100304]